MNTILSITGLLAGIGSLVCFVIVLIQMFQYREFLYAAACLVLTFVCGLGFILTWYLGVKKRVEWKLHTVMNCWCGCILVSIAVYLVRRAQKDGFGNSTILGLFRG